MAWDFLCWSISSGFFIALPTMQNFFNWNKFMGGKWKRSIDDDSGTEDYFEDSPIAQPQLDRIASYFELIEVSIKKLIEQLIQFKVLTN